MEIASQSQFGRPVSAVLKGVCPLPSHSFDKWELLSGLTEAAEIYELNHRTLNVLKALMTFWPERELPSDGSPAIVFPSNRTLSNRLNGMPESTLRRHLAQLVRLGLVSRHNSPNRKRYARSVGGNIQTAYGFDLSPISQNADHILKQAQAMKSYRDALALLRDRVAQLRQDLLIAEHAPELVERARQVLRRKPNETVLVALENDLSNALEAVTNTRQNTVENQSFTICSSPEMSTAIDQNERHIQDSIKQDSDSEGGRGVHDPSSYLPNETKAQSKENITLADVLGTLKEYRSYFPDAARCWDDLLMIADQMAPMLGIEQPVYAEAKQRMGYLPAALSVLCILERADAIRSPGAYLRKLSQKALSGGFTVMPMLHALQNRN